MRYHVNYTKRVGDWWVFERIRGDVNILSSDCVFKVSIGFDIDDKARYWYDVNA